MLKSNFHLFLPVRITDKGGQCSKETKMQDICKQYKKCGTMREIRDTAQNSRKCRILPFFARQLWVNKTSLLYKAKFQSTEKLALSGRLQNVEFKKQLSGEVIIVGRCYCIIFSYLLRRLSSLSPRKDTAVRLMRSPEGNITLHYNLMKRNMW